MKNIQPHIKYGIIYGIISVAISLFTFHVYFIGMFVQTILSFALLILFHYFTAKAFKNQNEGYLSYGETFKYLFIMSVVGFAISTIYTIIYMNYINPDAGTFLNEKLIEGIESTYRTMGLPEEQIMVAIEKMEEEFQKEDRFSIVNLLLGFVTNLFFVVFVVAITSLIFKKVRKE
jgi:hypothetical protein